MSQARDLADLGSSAEQGTVTGENLIINGDMAVSQRGTSETGVTSSEYANAPDRFVVLINTMGTWTLSQSTDAPSGFSNSYKWECTAADASPATGDYMLHMQRIEGQNLQHLKKGTSNAESVTASFWVKSAKTGTFILEIYDNDNTRSISKSYTINTANTWEYKTITFAGDTTGTLDDDNGESLVLGWWLGAGSTFTSGTLATSWESSTSANRAVGVENLADTIGNTWQITGVKLEVGSTATPFKHESYAENLAKCQRYYQQYTNPMLRGVCGTSAGNRMGMQLPVIMRSAPSVTITQTGSSSHFEVYDGNTTAVYSSTTASYLFKDKIEFDFSTSSGLTEGRAACLYSSTAVQSSFGISAEL